MDLITFQNSWVPKIQTQLANQIATDVEQPDLQAAMRYAVLAGGKRLRPLLTIAVLETFDVPAEPLLQATDAIELVHSYSLIHDDLPAMDDDQERRGQPTTHVKFGEDLAILAGDALQPLAFQWLSQTEPLSVDQRLKLVQQLAQAAGGNGMVGGQVLDMQYTGADTVTLAQATQVHELKTGALLRYSLVAGGIMADVDQLTLTALDQFGRAFGLGFQIKDDLDDLGQDDGADKQAYPTILTVPGAVAALQDQVDEARSALDQIKEHCQVSTDLLNSFLQYFDATLEKKW
ncbi:polyprenyl synthetase family protein [Weissella viridescens]|uniref:Farnesyl diphosphate synthase n=1 Tax=Weissella viridescens TaxID=1629 RepID=A0A3P2RE08_WEIVI|nr:farnesyl diphosphate synthase [Weissella viridescens]RRG18874.1 polyprenyl synthetase family protein [Weissella viridescens]